MTINSDDPLNRETSVSADLTETGVEAKTNSRAVAAFDRLVGNLAEILNSKLERTIGKRRAVTEAEVTVIRAAGKTLAERVGADPELATRALESHFEGVIRKQSNKEEVVLETVEQLRLAPPTPDDGPETVSEEFMAGFEPFAERAVTDALRAKWAKVLASEIKAPGTFTNKALRITDELDGKVAQLFERFCEFRLGDSVPKAVAPNLSFIERQALVNADLLVDPIIGHIRYFTEFQDAGGTDLLYCNFGKTGIAIEKSVPRDVTSAAELQFEDGKLALPIFLLTEAGRALASILPSEERSANDHLAQALADKMHGVQVRQYAMTGPQTSEVFGVRCVPSAA